MYCLRIALAAVIAPALMAAQAPPAEQAPKPPKPSAWDPNQIVCKKFPNALGTRIGVRRICKTNAEWDMIDRQQEEAVEKAQIKPFRG